MNKTGLIRPGFNDYPAEPAKSIQPEGMLIEKKNENHSFVIQFVRSRETL